MSEVSVYERWVRRFCEVKQDAFNTGHWALFVYAEPEHNIRTLRDCLFLFDWPRGGEPPTLEQALASVLSEPPGGG